MTSMITWVASGAVQVLLLAHDAPDALPQLDRWPRSLVPGAVPWFNARHESCQANVSDVMDLQLDMDRTQVMTRLG